MSDKLYIVIPAYNEEENIEKVVDEWYPIIEKHGNDSKLVVIDDGSKDATFAKLQCMAQGRPSLIPLSKSNGGHGSAILFGYHYALGGGCGLYFSNRLR